MHLQDLSKSNLNFKKIYLDTDEATKIKCSITDAQQIYSNANQSKFVHGILLS